MRISNLIGKMLCINQKPKSKLFLKFAYVFINALIGWNLYILNVLCQMIFPSSAVSEMYHLIFRLL